MWHLNPPSRELIKWYEKTMLNGLKNRILNNLKLTYAVKEILLPHKSPLADVRDESILLRLLTDTPESSIRLNDELMEKIKNTPQGVLDMINNLFKTRTSKKKEKDFEEPLIKILEKAFAFESEISQNKARSYELTHEQGRNTCTYCNRSYTFTVIRNEHKEILFPGFGKTNDKNRIARPHLDHWFDKASNPLLSLNIFNLIPSCPVCNSSLKGGVHFSLYTHIHPYIYSKKEPPFRFYIASNNVKGTRFPFVVKIDESLCDEMERRMIKDLALKEIYSYHGMLEAKDIYEWRLQNSADYLKEIFNNVSLKYRRSTEDVFRMFFGTEYLPDNNLDRPLSKLKRDIMIQIGLLDENGNFVG